MTLLIPPDVAEEVRHLELASRRLVRDLSAGDYASAFRGRGIEFHDVREYQVGDDVRSIDWRVTARMGVTYLRRHQEERELTLVLLVDHSSSTEAGSRRRTRAELAAQVAAVLALTAARANDRVGCAFFAEGLQHVVEPRKGRRHALRVIAELLSPHATRHTPHASRLTPRSTRLDTSLTQLHPILPRRAVVIILSDFYAMDFALPLARVARDHEVVCIQLADRLESQLPSVGLLRVRDPESGQVQVLDTSSAAVRAAVAERAARFDRTLRHDVHAAGAELLRLDAAEEIGDPLVTFFRQRARR